ncbi:MAG: radical SAM protein [bacterium]|nr:radical SAM protein [bacterium]
MRCIDIIKKVNPEIKIVVGGPHPSLMLDEVASNSKIDYIMLGEGEISFTNLLKNIQEGKNRKRIIQGIKPELDKLPFIDRELYEGFEKPCIEDFPSPFSTIIAGRGCIYNCSFCQPSEKILFGKKVRRRSVDNVVEELKILKKRYGFKSFLIHDDCLTEDKKWINEFCEKYKNNGFNQPFYCQTRADIICKNENLVKQMRDSGLAMFIIGFESGNQRILNFLRKGTTVEQNYKAAEMCKKYGIKIWANYMMGIPTETKKEMMDTVRMIKKIKPAHCSPAYYTPHPGSDLYTYCIENNLSLIANHDSYRRNPGEAKIKGVDYKFLNQALLDSMHYGKVNIRLSRIFLENKQLMFWKERIKKTFLGKILVGWIKKIIKYV